MKIRSIPLLALMAPLLVGCGVHRHFRDRYTFREDQVVAWRWAAVEAANSPAEWARLGAVRLTRGPLKLDTAEVEYKLDCREASQVEVIIRPATVGDQQASVLRIKVDRATALVVSMREELDR